MKPTWLCDLENNLIRAKHRKYYQRFEEASKSQGTHQKEKPRETTVPEINDKERKAINEVSLHAHKQSSSVRRNGESGV